MKPSRGLIAVAVAAAAVMVVDVAAVVVVVTVVVAAVIATTIVTSASPAGKTLATDDTDWCYPWLNFLLPE